MGLEIRFGYSHKLCATIALVYHRQETVVELSVYGWIGVYFSSLIAYRLLPVPKMLEHRGDGFMKALA